MTTMQFLSSRYIETANIDIFATVELILLLSILADTLQLAVDAIISLD